MLKGIKNDITDDLSQYNTLRIPDTIDEIYIDAFSSISLTHICFRKCGKYSSIRKIIFPNSIKTIWDGAFNGCTSIEYWDFTNWTAETIKNVHIFAFSESQSYWGCFSELEIGSKFYLNENLDQDSKNLLIKKTADSGAWERYWQKDTPNKIKLKSDSAKVQTTNTGKITLHFQMTESFADPLKVNLLATVWAKSLKGTVGTICDVPIVYADGTVDLPVHIFNPMEAGDYVEFEVVLLEKNILQL